MKMIKMVTLAAAVMLTARAGMAQETAGAHVWNNPHDWWGNHWVYGPGLPNKFTPNEFSIDAFGTYTAAERGFTTLFQNNIRRGLWGGGVGANYFFTRMVGISADINIPNDGGNFVNNVMGSLVIRFPVEQVGLAPYIFGGGGRTTDQVWDWTRHAGTGLEFRLNTVTGVFIDGRYVWADRVSDSVLLRAGLRFVF